jgi:hypothetical protein
VGEAGVGGGHKLAASNVRATEGSFIIAFVDHPPP